VLIQAPSFRGWTELTGVKFGVYVTSAT
jgi:hypothetical protein